MLTACGGKEKVESHTNTNTSVDSKPLKIVATIKPLQSIVLAILGDQLDNQASSFQLIPDHSSPHSASFKPSDIRKVAGADIIFRIDEHMEVMLNPLLEKHQDKLVSLADVDGITLINWADLHKAKTKILKEAVQDTHSANHEGHDHDEHESIAEEKSPPLTKADSTYNHAEEHGHHHSGQDMHIWTSPKNAMLMAQKIAQELSRLDPKNQKIYEKNLDTFDRKLGQESMQISQRLNGKTSIPYVVFHNSWQYFAHEFGLADPVVLNLHEGLNSGAKKISKTRQTIAALNIQCLFTDPDIAQSQVDALLSHQKDKVMHVVEIDVLGKKIKPDQEAYLNWLSNMAKSISDCLQ